MHVYIKYRDYVVGGQVTLEISRKCSGQFRKTIRKHIHYKIACAGLCGFGGPVPGSFPGVPGVTRGYPGPPEPPRGTTRTPV